MKWFVLGLMLMTGMTGDGYAAEGSIAAPEAIARAQAAKATFIDVRRPEEWQQTGMPADAVGIIWGDPDFAAKVLAEVKGDLSAPVVLLCRSGNRSGQAISYLRASGFTNVTHVGEGMIGSAYGPGWLARGLPLVPPDTRKLR